jgi:hypothetical protein
MSLDGQVLVIAFFAVALKLSLWSWEEGMAGGDVEPDRKDVLHLGDNGLRFQEGARREGAEDMVATALNPRSDRR